jgi:uncharacterized protein (UPF0248 family)
MGRSVHHPVGLIYKSNEVYDGYVLLTTHGGSHATLLDTAGRVVHRWNNDEGIVHAVLLPNGHLLCRTKPPSDKTLVNSIPGISSSILELDWEGDVVWRYDDSFLHHDFERIEAGNTLLLLFEPLDEDTTSKVRGGYRSQDDPESMLGDLIREVYSDGVTKREWRISDSLCYTDDVICPLENRKRWTHGNSLKITANGDFLVSLRNINTVGIISKETGHFLWKWGPGQIWHQHHASFLDNGNILIFDNGSHSKGIDRSRVVEINPQNDEIVWEYTESPPVSFFSFHISSADRLSNGNTFICEGAYGRVFEVTRDGEIVWEFVNPFQCPDMKANYLTNMVYRAHKYPVGYSAFVEKELDHRAFESINRSYLNGKSGSGLIIA